MTRVHRVLAAVERTPEALTLTWQNGTRSEYASLWLRDNAPGNRDAMNGQRLISILDVPAAPRLSSATHSKDEELTVLWSDGYSATFAVAWLCEHDPSRPRVVRPARCPWISQAAAVDFCWSDYPRWSTDETERRAWLGAIARDGIAFLRNVATEHAIVLSVGSLIGFVRETNYGRIFDVRSVAQPNNLAYTSLALPVHTDNPYRDPVPGLQLLHCLSNAGHGGDSLFIDGLKVAEDLRTHEPEAFATLSRVPIRYRFQDATTDLECERTMLEMDAQGQFHSIYFNDRSIAPLPLTGVQLDEYYVAYRKISALLRDPGRTVVCRLNPGDLVVFDNTRVLHGRTGFALEDGVRHLQGCYTDADALYSALAVLSRKEAAPCL